jgi:beta-galactosidase
VDAHGTVVPSADNLIAFQVSGGSLAGVDSGRPESAERYQASTRAAFHGKALAIVRTGTRPGALAVSASSAGLHPGSTLVHATGVGAAPVTPPTALAPDPGSAAPIYPLADAGYSGSPSTLPAAMLDGNPATGWSNYYAKSATALLRGFAGAGPASWVSVSWAVPQTFDRVEVSFTVDALHARPAGLTVSVWNGYRYVPVGGSSVSWATASDAPTVVTFDPVRGSRLRLDLTSGDPAGADAAQRISTLSVPVT